jgi:hypothetical protein
MLGSGVFGFWSKAFGGFPRRGFTTRGNCSPFTLVQGKQTANRYLKKNGEQSTPAPCPPKRKSWRRYNARTLSDPASRSTRIERLQPWGH